MQGSVIDQNKGLSGRLFLDDAFLYKIEKVKYHPIFVLGNHRSGTTILYKLLALTESFNIVKLYHTLRYDSLLAHHMQNTSDEARAHLNQQLDALGIRNRIIDEMNVNADYPDEYCFVLITRKRTFQIKYRSWKLFDEMCRKIQFISDPGRHLLLKNPFDYTNFSTIIRFIPSTKFIFIHRHPAHVINSALNAIRTSWYEGNPLNQLRSGTYTKLQRNWLFSGFIRWMVSPRSHFQLARRLITRRLRKSETHFMQKIKMLEPDVYISVRYEDLITEPSEVINRILKFLQVKASVQVDFKHFIRPRPFRLLPEIKKEEDRICQMFHDVLIYHGYQDAYK